VLAKKKKADVPKDLYQLTRLTAGDTNQFTGSIPDSGDALYYVSDANVSTEVFVQSPISSAPRLLFDENADVSNPQVSPDGTLLAFISTRSDSSGDACIRDLKTGESWCKTGLESSELQVDWSEDGKRLLILKREGINGSMRLVSVSPGPDSSEETVLVERDMLRPSIHPGGEWFAYVPLAPDQSMVGVSFSQKATAGIALQRAGEKPILYVPELPGESSLPSFGEDGKSLYFVQYLNDTNGDGEIDGNDNAVVFRVAFDGASKRPTKGSRPEQLSSARQSCMYPNPESGKLILTCSRRGSLDLYSLPLTGMVPVEWDAERIRGEIRVARDHWTKLLLLGHLFALDVNKESQVEVMRRMLVLHLDLHEYASSLFYANHIIELSGAKSETGQWGQIARILVEQRSLEEGLARGMESGSYVREARDLLERLSTLKLSEELGAFSSMVRGEIRATLGARSEARELMDEVLISSLKDPITIKIVAAIKLREYELEADHEAIISLFEELAMSERLETVDRLRYADLLVREIFRGRATEERLQLAEQWLKKVVPESELAMKFAIHRALLTLTDATEEQVREAIFEIYKANKDKVRRKALALITVEAASERNNEYLQYQFINTWASGVKRKDPERKYAERLFQEVVLERAYIEWSKGEMSESRGYFFATTKQTDSLEAHIGFIEAYIKEGKKDIEGNYAKKFKKKPDDPTYQFIKAYLKTRTLGEQETRESHDRVVGEALALLAPAIDAYPRSVEVQHLWGTLLHHRYVHQGLKSAALDALPRYLIAMDLAQNNPRYLAATSLQMGMLQASLGNHRLALSAFKKRARLPYPRPEVQLNLEMAMARSLFYVGRADEAMAWLEKSEATIENNPQLAQYTLMVLDRRGLYAKEASRWEESVTAYREVQNALGNGKGGPIAAPLNRLKATLGQASAEIGGGQYEAGLKLLDDVDGLLADTGPLRPNDPERAPAPVDQYVFDRAEYKLVALGLRARANFALGRYSAATIAMIERRDRLNSRISEFDLDEDLLESATASYFLAEYALSAGKKDEAQSHLEDGLNRSAAYNERTGSVVNIVGTRLLQSYAELHLFSEIALSALGVDLRDQLELTYGFMCDNPSPNWEPDRFLLGVYLTMLEAEG